MKVLLSKIMPNPLQPRRVFNEQAMSDLTDSMNELGMIQPVVVEAFGEQYIIIDGERRWRAAQRMGWTELEVHVREGQLVNRQKLVLAVAANVQRSDLNPIEEAQAYLALKAMDLSIAAIARRVGTSDARVASRMRLLDMDEEIQQQVASGNLPTHEAVMNALKAIPDRDARVKLALKLAERKAGVKTILAACATLKAALEQDAPDDGQPAGLRIAMKKVKPDRARWDALAQTRLIPPYPLFVQCVRTACKDCSLGDIADSKVCSGCPVVILVQSLNKETVNEY